jgi:hypothetical protein
VEHFPYQAVVRLVRYAAHYWHAIDGEAALRGVNLLELPMRRFLAAIYHWLMEHTAPKEEDRLRLHEELHSPLPGADPDKVSQEVIDDEMAIFQASMARQGAKG